MIFFPFSVLIFFLLVILLPFFFVLIQIEIIGIALGKLGLSPQIAFLIFLACLAGSLINIPLFRRETSYLAPGRRFFSLQGINPSEQVIAVNVGGCLIPLFLCFYLMSVTPLMPVAVATVVTTAVCFKTSRVVPGTGITVPALIPPLIAVVLAYLIAPQNKIPVAYVSGVLGVLIGADILKLPFVGRHPGVISIGGAGVFDGIFLVGIISALLA